MKQKPYSWITERILAEYDKYFFSDIKDKTFWVRSAAAKIWKNLEEMGRLKNKPI